LKAIVRRLRRVEEILVPRASEQYRRSVALAEMIRERRRRRLEAAGLPFHESPPLVQSDYNGTTLGIAETLRAVRDQRLRLAAPDETWQ
jgi:hypothetical protein